LKVLIFKKIKEKFRLKLLEEDRRYFAAADLNGDLKLNFEEFVAFQNPEHAEHMHDILIQVFKISSKKYF